MQVQELVGIVPWTFIAQICNLFLQMYLIKRFLFKPVNEMLQKRRSMADAEIQDATKAKEEALAMKTEYEQNMQQAKAKASDIVTEAQRTASLQSEEILKSAAQEARAMKEKAEDDREPYASVYYTCTGEEDGLSIVLYEHTGIITEAWTNQAGQVH